MELQGAQQADRFEHLGDVHLQTALQLDEEPADLRVDLPVLWPEMLHSRKLFCYRERVKFMPMCKLYVYVLTLRLVEDTLRDYCLAYNFQTARKKCRTMSHIG